MIISFSVSNFRSFQDEETLSLVASGRLSGTHSEHLSSIPKSHERALRAAVVYGANGAGKSNLFKALSFLKRAATEPRKSSGTGREPFRFAAPVKPETELDLQFIMEGKHFRFQVKMNDHFVTEESLVHVSGEKEVVLYERTTTSTGSVSVTHRGALKATPKLKALCTVGGPANQTFLATAIAVLQREDLGPELRRVYRWFTFRLQLISPGESFAPVGHVFTENPDFLSFAGEFLKDSSTGVDSLEVVKNEISEDDLRKLLPQGILEHVMASVPETDKTEHFVVGSPDGEEFIIDKTDKHFHKIDVRSLHKSVAGLTYSCSLTDESDGTRRLLELTPTLRPDKKENSVFFVDEIDRSLHPILVRKFIQFFLMSAQCSSCQLITTTHESSLLDLDLLRRDEIWFAEKDQAGSTKLYSLNDFKVRNDLEIRKHYFQGRFGAIPFLGNLDLLLQPPMETQTDAQSTTTSEG